ncbi:MAG: dienelactone hydrolase family protein, partial [Ginsengibacter sp.]
MSLKLFVLGLITLVAVSCNNADSNSETTDTKDSTNAIAPINIKEDSVSYNLNGTTYIGFIAYDANKEGKRPGILVVHEWWGLTNYTRNRAKQLAELGYIAMAVDMYGNGKTGDDPASAQALATPFYKDPTLAKIRLDAAMNELKTYLQTDSENMAAIGYCYGGFIVLNAAKLGADLKG